MSATKSTSSDAIAYDYKDFCAAFGKRVKAIRKERDLTLRDMVMHHGFHQTQVQRIEKGEGISLKTMLLVAQSFQLPLEHLIAGIGLQPPSVPSQKDGARKTRKGAHRKQQTEVSISLQGSP